MAFKGMWWINAPWRYERLVVREQAPGGQAPTAPPHCMHPSRLSDIGS